MSEPVLILGMHRSGTSALAGSLERAGLHLGPVNQRAAFNKRGNREHEAIRKIHDAVLAHHGFAWDAPPRACVSWPEAHIENLQELTSSLETEENWGVKDPRTVWCLEGWRRLFKPRFVISYRHPSAVTKSLQNRAKAWGLRMSDEKAHALWTAYNSAILRETRETNCEIIRFDVPADEYLISLRRVADTLGLDCEKVTEFFSDDLRNVEPPVDEEVPHISRPVWDELQMRASSKL